MAKGEMISIGRSGDTIAVTVPDTPKFSQLAGSELVPGSRKITSDTSHENVSLKAVPSAADLSQGRVLSKEDPFAGQVQPVVSPIQEWHPPVFVNPLKLKPKPQ